jgi:hypothetical protein
VTRQATTTSNSFCYDDSSLEVEALSKGWHISVLDTALDTAGTSAKAEVFSVLKMAFEADEDGKQEVDD